MQRSEWLCGRVCPLWCVSHSRRPQPETLVHSGLSFWQRFCQTVIWSWKVKKSLTLAVFSMRLWLLTWTNNSAGQLSIFHRQDAGLAHGGFVHFHWRPSRNLRYVWLVVLFGRLVRCKTGVTATLSDTQRPLKQFPWTGLLQSTPAEAEWDPSNFTIDAKTHSKFQTLNESISCLNDAKFFWKRFELSSLCWAEDIGISDLDACWMLHYGGIPNISSGLHHEPSWSDGGRGRKGRELTLLSLLPG